ncbi:universal stress protein [Planobispora siamensis]|uniref:Universal stress protein n=1 Tax=Planobispora siamensis TaxID=936338 RepID=A0A8J3SPF8_9ACTN|nr:universal stress protein [Planobispora siamensis]GIH96295.1 universal stress protein [Planobispora siamensis]
MTDPRTPAPGAVVVGYDGSDFSMQALDWAMDEAELRRAPLTITHAWRWPYGRATEEARLHLRKAAEHVLYHGVDCARSTSTLTDVRADLHEGAAAERLVELSDGAQLVVVGSRGLDALARSVVGSVAGYTATHSHAPVIIVRGPGPIPAPVDPGPLVLGLGASTADAVVDFAFTEAALRQLRLVAVHASYPQPMAWGVAMAPLPDPEAALAAERDRMRERLAPWRERHPGVPVEYRSVTVSAGDALEAAGAEAVLLVVGAGRSWGRGRLGTVARAMTEHAPCPVAVVPDRAGRPPG